MNETSKTNPKTPLKQLNFKVQPDFYWKLKNFASTKRIKMAEVLEKAFEFYQKREALVKEINNYQQSIPVIEQQLKPFLSSMSLMELEIGINNLDSAPFNKIGLVITYEAMKGALGECLRLARK